MFGISALTLLLWQQEAYSDREKLMHLFSRMKSLIWYSDNAHQGHVCTNVQIYLPMSVKSKNYL